MPNPSILVVDDEIDIAKEIGSIVSEGNFDVEVVSSGKEALKRIKAKHFDVVLLDIKMPLLSGIAVLKEIKKITLKTEVVMLTALDEAKLAWEASKIGAYAYITKPYEIDQLLGTVRKALEEQKLKQENICLKKIIEENESGCDLVGKSVAIKEVRERIAAVSKSNSTILITGESGTGKEIVARSIHKMSSQSQGPFVALNCAAIPDNLVEAELFGHERGSYTGAVEQGLGKFEMADNGTIFLDEISSMPIASQAKLLRVLEDKTIERIGGRKTIPVNVRVISATNMDLKQAVKEKTFRQDLYYRLNVISVFLPPLRDRKEDIPLFLDFFLSVYNKELNKNIKGFAKEVLKILADYDWPGNVRELKNLIERQVVLGVNGSLISKDSLLLERDLEEVFAGDMLGVLKKVEFKYIKKVLEEVKGNKSRAAKILGFHRGTLDKRIKALGIKVKQ